MFVCYHSLLSRTGAGGRPHEGLGEMPAEPWFPATLRGGEQAVRPVAYGVVNNYPSH